MAGLHTRVPQLLNGYFAGVLTQTVFEAQGLRLLGRGLVIYAWRGAVYRWRVRHWGVVTGVAVLENWLQLALLDFSH